MVTLEQFKEIQLDNFDSFPPTRDRIGLGVKQLDPKSKYENIMYLGYHTFELGDTIFPYLSPIFDYFRAKEGFYLAPEDSLKYTHNFPTRQSTVYSNLLMFEGSEIHHERAVFDTLIMLANIGGVQLILTATVSWLVTSYNDKKSMISIVKKYFIIKTKDTTFAKEPYYTPKGEAGPGYKFKLDRGIKMTLCNYFFSCFGKVPACSKNQRRYIKLLNEGEERI